VQWFTVFCLGTVVLMAAFRTVAVVEKRSYSK